MSSTTPQPVSPALFLASLPDSERAALLGELTNRGRADLLYHWPFWARPNQLPPPGDWRVWLLLAGRGFGKTRTGAEWVRLQVERGAAKRIALVAPTAADARDVMVEGDSGVLAVSPPWNRPLYEPSKRRLTWPNGAVATTYSADEPERLRGPQHDAAWCDEVAAWAHADPTSEARNRGTDTWDMLQFGLRLGDDPRIVVTTTPKPVELIRQLVAASHTVVTRGSSYENRANLAPGFFTEIVRRYEGTRLGRQELLAEILDDAEGAIFKLAWLKAYEVRPRTLNVYIMGDYARGRNPDNDRTALAVIGIDRGGTKYLLDGVCHRMPLSKRWSNLRDLHKKWSRQSGVQNVFVGYERYGAQSDDEYFRERMEIERYHFPIEELNWVVGRGREDQKKENRVQRLEPDFVNGRFRLPLPVWSADRGPSTWRLDGGRVVIEPVDAEHGGVTAAQLAAMEGGAPETIARAIRQVDEERKVYDLTLRFVDEYQLFPFGKHDDLLDACSRVYDLNPRPPLIVTRQQTEPPQYFDS